MNNPAMAKVMYPIDGKPMVERVVRLAARLHVEKIIVVVGWQKDSVVQYLRSLPYDIRTVEQVPQLGTGHAVMQTEPELGGFDGDVLVLSGDVPLLSYHTIRSLVESHRNSDAFATVLTAELDDPTGYGRMVRNKENAVLHIVEHNDASEQERQIKEINSGIYVFDRKHLFDALKTVQPNNIQKEYYLTDVLEYFWRNNLRIGAVKAEDPKEIQGINTPAQLAYARSVLENHPI